MDNLITVVSLQGKAWAVASDGSRRELHVGDTVAMDEMVVTAAGAQIELQFADNQVLTLIGEQNVSSQAVHAASTEFLSEPLASIEPKRSALEGQQQNSALFSEGHGFVQLVRIAEIIESDGFTPLTVARIQEIIQPLGMILPERDFAQERWKEQISDRTHRNEHHDFSALRYKLSIHINVIAGDDVINAAEAGRSISVTGTVSGDVKPGDKVTVIVNGKTYESKVNADGTTWTADIPGRELAQDTSIAAIVTSQTPSGKPITANTSRPYEVDEVTPNVKVELESGSGPNGGYNEDDTKDGKVKGEITFDPNTTQPGDKITVTDKDGNPILDPNGKPIVDYELTPEDITNGIIVDVPVNPGDKEVELKVTVTDPAGNTSTGRDEKPVDNLTPGVSVELEPGSGPNGDFNNDDVKDGKVTGTVTFDPNTTEPGDVVQITGTDGSVIIERPITQDDIDNGILVDVPVSDGQTTVEITAKVTDPAGNSSTDSDDNPVDSVIPGVIVELEPGSDPNGGYNEDDTKDGKVEGKITFDPNTTQPGDKITVTDKDGNPILDPNGDPITDYEITQGDIDNGIVVEVPVSPGDTEVELNVKVTDPAGNESTGSDSKVVDNITPQLSVEIEGEGSSATYDAAKITNGQAKIAVTLVAGTVEAGDQLVIKDSNGDIIIDRPITQAEVASGKVEVKLSVATGQQTINVEAIITDPAGNSSNDTDSKVILAPELTIDSTTVDDGAGTIDISGKTTDVAPGSNVEVTITDKDNNTVTVTVQTDANGDYVVTGEDITGLTDGPLDIKAETTDHNGNTIDATATDSMDHVAGSITVDNATVDDGAKTVDIDGKTTDVSPGTTVTITITDKEGNVATGTTTVDNNGNYSADNVDISNLVDGDFDIEVSSTDNNGNPVNGTGTGELDNVAGAITVEFTDNPVVDAAVTKITGTTTDVAAGETVSLTFTDQNMNTVTTTAVVANDGAYTVTVDLRGLTDGTITVDATATDRNGGAVSNDDMAVLDAIAANITIDNTSVNDGAGTIDISGSTTDVAPNTQVNIKITDKDGNEVTATATTDANGDYVVNGTDITGLTDGDLTITAETTDHNGNTINGSAADTMDHVTGDLTVDSTTVDSTGQTVDISGSTTDVHPGETVTITITDQEGNVVTVAGPVVVQPDGTYSVTGEDISSLVDGSLTIDASSTDNNGNPVSGTDNGVLDNLTGSITVAFTNDPIADPAFAAVTGSTQDVAPGATVTLTFTSSNGGAPVVVTAVVAADGTYSTTADVRGLTDGNITVAAAATDRNSDPVSATDNAVLDAIAANITIDSTNVDDAVGTIDISGSTTDVAPNIQVNIKITDKDGNEVTATATTDANGDYVVNGTDITGLTDGDLTITAETTDHNGNTINGSAADTLDHVTGDLTVDSTTVDSTGQTVDISGSTTDVHPGEIVTVTITDQEGNVVTVAGPVVVQPDGTYSVTGEDISSLVDGPLTIDASSTDNNGNPVSGTDNGVLDNLTGSITVAFTNDPIADPAFAAVTGSTQDVAPGATVTLTFTSSNGGAPVVVTAVVAADGTYSTTADVRGLTDGNITVAAAATDRNSDPVSATDNAVLDAIAANITIDSTNVDDTAGTIDISGSTTDVAPNTQVNIKITDKDGNEVTATATTDANGDYVVNGTDITGLTDGDLTITAETTDHNGNTINGSAADTMDHVTGDLTVDSTTVDSTGQTVDISGSTTDVHPGETVTITITDQEGNVVTVAGPVVVQPDGTYSVTGEDISSLVDGPLTIDASSTDNNGNPVSGTDNGVLDNLTGSITVAFTNDPIADPAFAAVTGSTQDVAPGATVTLTFTSSNGGAPVVVTAVVAADGTYSTTADVRGLTDGNITVAAAATDRNSDPVSATDNAVLDAIAANITIDSTNVDDTAGTIDISGSTTDVAPNTQVNIKITDKDGNEVTATATTDANGDYVVNGTDITGLTDGDLTITAETTDHNGNTINGSAADTMDHVTGDLTVDSTTVDSTGQTVDISGSTTDVHPGETVIITITDQEGNIVTVAGPVVVQPDGTYSVTGEDISGLVDGPLTIDASSTDNNGNPVSGTDNGVLDNLTGSITVAFTNDPIADPAFAAVTGSTQDVAPGATVTLTFTSSNGGAPVVVTAVVAADGTYSTTADVRGLTDGNITVAAAATDRNSDPVSATDNAVLDAIAANITIDSTNVDDAAGTIDISGETTDVAPGETVTLTITDKDSNSITVVGPVTVQADGTYSVSGTDISTLIDGPLTITATATDYNGDPVNATATDSMDHVLGSITVDNATVDDGAKTVDIDGKTTDVSPGTTVNITITDKEGNVATGTTTVDNNGNYSADNVDISNLVDGDFDIEVSSTDNNGNPVNGTGTGELDNVAGAITVEFTDNPVVDAAVTKITGTTTDVAAGETVSLTFTDQNTNTVTTTAVVANDGAYTVTVDLRGLTDGTITVDATATDRNGGAVSNDDTAVLDAIAANITIDSTNVDDAVGTIDISGKTTDVAPGETVTLTITDKDSNSITVVGPVTVQADGTYSVSGTDISTLTDGDLTITAETTDHNGNTINGSAADTMDHVTGDLTVDSTTVDSTGQTVDISGSTTDVHPGETVTITITDQEGNVVTVAGPVVVQPDGTYSVTGEDISSLVDGPLTIDASSTDNNGNPVSGTDNGVLDNLTGSITVAFTNDPIADPAFAAVTGSTQDVAPGATVTLTFTSSNGGAPVVVTAVVAADGTYSTTADVRGLTDGNITVAAAATDRNSDPVSATDNAVLDAIAANITIDSTNVDDAVGTIDISGKTTDVAPGETVTLTITDKDSNSITVVGPVTVQADGTYSVSGTDISTLTDGDLTITAETTDHNGNTINGSAADTMDHVTGDLTVDSTTVDSTGQTVDISGSTTDVHPGETVIITITDQEGNIVTVAGPVVVQPDGTYSVTGEDISGLVDGPLTIDASSTDNNGNPVSGDDTATLDHTTDTITVSLDDVTSANETAVLVTGTTTDVVPGETVTLTFTDGTNTHTAIATVAQDGSYVTIVDLSSLDDGPISVEAEAAGRNQTVTHTDSASKDVLAPSLSITSVDATLASGDDTVVTFTFSEAVTGFDATDITVTGGTLTNLTTTDNITWTADFSADGSGNITIDVANGSYTDTVGNLGSGNNHTINTAPNASDVTLTAEDAESFVFEASTLFTDADGDTLTYSANSLPTGLTINASTGLISGDLDSSASQVSGGVYTIQVTVSDGQGGTDTAAITLNVANPAPVIDATIDDKAFDDSDVVSIQTAQAFSDPDGDTLSYSASNLPTGLSINSATGLITGTLDSSASQGGTGGIYIVTVTANDNEGGTISTDFNISVSNPAPVIDPVQGKIADDGEFVEIQTQFTDPDGDALTYSIVSGAPAGFTIDTNGKISGTLASDASQKGVNNKGVYHIKVKATDADGAEVTDTIELIVYNPAPVVDTPLNNATADDGAAFTLDTSTAFTDPDGDTLSYSVTGLPNGLIINPATGIITGTLSKQASQHGVAGDGKYTIVVTANDGQGGTISETFELAVSNTAPEAVNDDASTDENVVLNVNAANGVLDNDTDPNSDTLTVTQISQGGNDVSPGMAIAGDNGGVFRIYPDGSYSFDPNGEFDSLAIGEKQQSSVTYTISDGKGGTDTAQLTITINGVNNPPVAEDDQVISDTSGVTIDVLSNDSDVDATDTLTVTQINGTAISISNPVNTSDGQVTLNTDGTLTFVPASSFTGNQTSFDYTISDGNGGTDSATVIVDVVRVSITDNNSIDASLAYQGTPDGTLASIDDLANTQITGSIPQGGSIVSLEISDGTTTITVDPSTIAIYPNGSFITTVDTSALDDGNISVNLVAKNNQGNQGASADTIFKDTVTEVEIDPLDVVNGEVPVVTGTGEPEATIIVSVDDGTGKVKVGEAIVDNNGDWTFTPTNPIDPSFKIIADATDKWGNTEDINGDPASDSRDIPSLDTGLTIEVDEAGLIAGSDAGNKPIAVTSSFTLGGNDDLQHIVVDGTTVTKAALEDLAANPVTITQGHYTIELTGYNSATGVVSYTYTLTDSVAHDAPPTGTDSDTNIKEEAITVVVVDVNNDTRTGTIKVEITDDVPTATDGALASVDEGGNTTTGNLLTNDVQGADEARVYDITYNDTNGDPQTALVDATNGVTVTTQFGALTVNSNGSWSYTSNNAVHHDQPANDDEIADNFVYRLIDGDGDISNAATQRIDVKDTEPEVGTADNATVDEASLATGSTPNTGALTQTGSLAVTKAADDIDTQFVSSTVADFEALTLTSNGTNLTYVLSADGHTLTATAGVNTVFTATITNPTAANAGYEFVLSAPLDHVKSANDTELDLPFNFIVTDKDGDTATGSFKVTVTDDVPVAANDSNTVAKASYTAVTGNVISTGAGAGADTQGADGATVTQVSFDTTDVTVPTDNTSTTINGTYGVLTIQADGSYSYQRSAGTAGGVNDEFAYTLTDGDGDTENATLTVNITDAAVSITDLTPQASGGDVTVLESKLTGGTGVDTGAATASGTFTISSPDGIQELSVTQGANTYSLIDNNGAFTPQTITTALGNTLNITAYNPTTGVVTYNYELISKETHTSGGGRNDLFENFTINLKDMDDDTTTGDLAVRIVDDIPLITQNTTNTVALEADESDFSINADANFSVLFGVDHGADGAATSNATVYTLSANALSGLVDTASNESVTLTVNTNGTVVTGTADEHTVFTITINSATGEITLDQVRAVTHSDTVDHNDAVSIDTNAVSITATATDGDGDKVTSTIAIGDRFTFLDDGPSIAVGVDTGAVTVLTDLVTKDAETLTGASTTNANFAGAFIVDSSDYRADGDGGTVWAYTLGLKNEIASLASGLSTGGDAINLYVVGSQIVGSTAATSAGITAGNTAFTVTVDGTGQVALTQQLPIDHSDTNSSNETIALVNDLITLTGTATITDGDGDTASSSQTINIGDKFVFTDDGPTVGAPVDSTVNEANLVAGSATDIPALTQTGGLAIGVSADGVDTQFTSTTVADFNALGLTSNGTALSYTLSADGHTLTATAGANPVFTATITNPSAANAGYTFVLSAPLDHVAPGKDSLDLPFNFVVTDKDGDTATGSFKVTVTDDMPFAENDSNTVAKASYTAVTGNVISTGTGKDTVGADGATVTQVVFNGTSYNVPADNSDLVINAAYGDLTIKADGSYSYQRSAGTPGGVSDEFTYTLTDGDNDTDSATLTITIANAGVSVGGLTDDTASSDAVVHESAFTNAGGRDAGTGVDAGSITASQNFTISSPDGIAELSITHGSSTYNLVLNNLTQTLPTITTTLGNTLEITGYNASTGVVNYTYTLVDNESHGSAGRDNLFENFTVNLEDMDGDSTTSDLAVRIVDDIPLITQDTTNTVAVEVDESDFAINATANFSGLFGVNHGADGAATSNAVVYTLDVNTVSDLVDTASNEPVALTVNANGTVVTGTADGNTVFTITIDSATGEITLDQLRAVKHNDITDHNDAVSITQGAVSITATATDGDGDEVTSTIAIGDRFTFLDDGPAITVDTTKVGAIELDESNLTGASQSITVADFADGVFTTDFGADGAASKAGFVYSLTVSSNAVNSGLKDTASGEDILLRVNGSGDVEGYVAAGNLVVFTVSVDGATGAMTLEQVRALSHPDTNNHDDVVNILNGTIQLVGTATDGDGDTAVQSTNIGDKISFKDDGPSITAVTAETIVDEKGLPAGSDPDANLLSASASLNVDFGTDGAGDVQFTIGTTAHLKTLSLKAGGTDLEFVIDNNNHSLTAYRGTGREAGDKVFTVDITSPTGTPGYDFILHAPIDHAGAADRTLAFQGIQVTDGDGDSVLKDFSVKVVDDASQSTLARTVDEDDTVTFNTSADANPTNTTIYNQADNALTGTSNSNGGVDYKTDYGTVTVNADGTITYKPDANYSGEDVFIFKTQDGDSTEDTTVTMTVTPVADAPELEDDKPLITNEDVSIALGLQMPVITDNTDRNGTAAAGDDPERLGEITLTLTGDAIGTLTKGDDSALIGSGGVYKFVITNVADLHLKGLTSGDATVNYVTQAEYEAIKALPAADRHENFDVEVSVKSYEVDGSGVALDDAQVGGVNGAQSTQTITVDVRAVTDAVGLKVQEDVTQTDVSVVISGGDKIADVTLNEDNSFNLTSILNPDAFVDTDGSETRYLGIHGLPDGTTIEVDGTPFIIGSSPITTFDFGDGNGAVPAIEFVGTQTTLPVITITPPADFSGDINGLTVTLGAIDSDSDSTAATPVLEKDTVTINLHVNPIAGDVVAGSVSTPEDTPVDFLKHIEVTDKVAGTEVITAVEFALPTGWVLSPQGATGSFGGAEWTLSGDGSVGSPYEITFTAGTEAQREAALKQFEVTPPAHSSKDETINVKVSTADTNTVNGVVVTHTEETNFAIKVTVTPVAEVVGADTDDDGTDDLTIMPDYTYQTDGFEDTWFDLGTDGSNFSFSTGWSNQDGKAVGGSEDTFAVLTPSLFNGDGTPASAIGSKFKWTEGGIEKIATFTGEPIEVPMGSLGSLEFMTAKDFAGTFKIKVQAKTVDYDADNSSQTVEVISGEATLTSGVIKPVADASTTSLTARVNGVEDEPMNLSIRPNSTDPSEIFNVTLDGIPNGATLTYGSYTITEAGVFDSNNDPVTDPAVLGNIIVTAGAGEWEVEFKGFDKNQPMTITPPLDSNDEFTLGVSTVTVDTLFIPDDINDPTGPGTTYTDVSTPPEQLGVVIAPKGVADPAEFELNLTSLEYTEAVAESTGINVSGLIAKAELKDDDGSETLTFKISNLPAGFTITGATFIRGTGANREWSLTKDQLNTAMIKAPANFNGQLNFDIYTITTEDDGDSLTEKHPVNVTITPSPEAEMNLSKTIDEDVSTQLDFSVIHKNGDADEFISKVWIKVDSVTDGLTLILNGNPLSTKETIGGADYYVVEQGDLNKIYAQGATNWHGTTDFEVKYEVTDPGNDGLANVSTVTDSTYEITVTPVTDPVTVAVTEGADTTLNSAGTVNVKLAVGNTGSDYDGSESLTRIIVENVPDGVVLTNPGSDYLGGNTWVIVANTAMGAALAPELNFQVHGFAGGLVNHPIKVTVVSEDAGNGTETTANTTVTITTTFDEGDKEDPAEINRWEQTTFEPTEDASFTLKQAINAKIDATGVTDSNFTVTLKDLPTGTTVTGMNRSVIDGKEIWSATGSGGDAELQTLLAGITVTAPADFNSNNGPFKYDATLATHVPSGGRAQKSIVIEQAVIPVTDEAVITITAPAVDEGNNLKVRAQTVESGAPDKPSEFTDWKDITTNISGQLSTNTGDTLLWTGDVIDGRGGDDTIQLRFGESVSTSELVANLSRIEVLDLSIKGANVIGASSSGLSIHDVLSMTDSRNTLKIDGDSEDTVYLDSGWKVSDSQVDGYTTYTDSTNEVVLNIAQQIQQSILID